MLMDLFFEASPVARKRRAHFHEFMADVHERVHAFRQKLKVGEVSDEDPIRLAAASWRRKLAPLLRRIPRHRHRRRDDPRPAVRSGCSTRAWWWSRPRTSRRTSSTRTGSTARCSCRSSHDRAAHGRGASSKRAPTSGSRSSAGRRSGTCRPTPRPTPRSTRLCGGLTAGMTARAQDLRHQGPHAARSARRHGRRRGSRSTTFASSRSPRPTICKHRARIPHHRARPHPGDGLRRRATRPSASSS